MQLWHLSYFSRYVVPIVLLTTLGLGGCITSQPPKPFSSETLPTEAIAEISEIRSYPVRVRYVNTSSYTIAAVGTPLKVNESVRTEDNSSAQINLSNGVIMRVGGASNLMLKAQNQVEIKAGKLIAWTSGDRKAAAQIQTPFGEVSSNSGTIYIEIPDQATTDRRIIALDGTVNLLLKKSSKIVSLNKGEEIIIKGDGSASEPQPISKDGINKYIANNKLLFGFSNQLDSLNTITAQFGVTATVKEANTIQFRRSDLPTKPTQSNNNPTVNTTSNTNKSFEVEQSRQREEIAPERPQETTSQPPQPEDPSPNPPIEPSPPPLPNDPPPSSLPTEPIAPPPEQPQQPTPVEPPAAPVQPEIIPIAPSPKP